MDATYNADLSRPLDWMRDALDDINTAAPFAPDVTYLAYLEEAQGNWRLGAAAMARKMASRAINSPSSFTAVGDVSVSWGDRAALWHKAAAALEAESSRLDVRPSEFWSASVSRGDLEPVDDGEYSIALRGR